MAKVCEICGKKANVGYKVSGSQHHTKRRQSANLQKVTALVGGQRKRILVCTSCIQAGKVKKPG